VAEGTVDQIKANPNSVTGKFLSHADKIDVPTARRKYGKNTSIKIFNARENNLKNIDVEIPLGMFVAITGVSGAYAVFGSSGLQSSTVLNSSNRSFIMPLVPRKRILNDSSSSSFFG
jgi:excinuclease ABC subunit A